MHFAGAIKKKLCRKKKRSDFRIQNRNFFWDKYGTDIDRKPARKYQIYHADNNNQKQNISKVLAAANVVVVATIIIK